MSSQNIANESGDSPSVSSTIYFDKENTNISNIDTSEMAQPVGNQLINIHNEFNTLKVKHLITCPFHSIIGLTPKKWHWNGHFIVLLYNL